MAIKKKEIPKEPIIAKKPFNSEGDERDVITSGNETIITE